MARNHITESNKVNGRQNTQLESSGAEFLVLGNLLIEKIAAYKAYTNMAGYDLVAISPIHNTSARIQVKSRWKTNADGFIINNFNCDFVVVVKLNRGSKDGKAAILPPEYYIMPISYVQSLKRSEIWGKVQFRNLPEIDKYKNGWGLIREFLTSPVVNQIDTAITI